MPVSTMHIPRRNVSLIVRRLPLHVSWAIWRSLLAVSRSKQETESRNKDRVAHVEPCLRTSVNRYQFVLLPYGFDVSAPQSRDGQIPRSDAIFLVVVGTLSLL